MRKVAGYAFTIDADSEELALSQFKKTVELVDRWLASKGTKSVEHQQTYVVYPDGRRAELVTESVKCGTGELYQVSLLEPATSGLFSTVTTIGMLGKVVAVHAELRVAGDAYHLAPLRFDVRCPQVIRDIIDSGGAWYIGEVPVTTRVVPFNGIGGGRNFVGVVWHASRNLPVVAISSDQENRLGQTLAEDIARDLSGLAIVAKLDSVASWTLTNERGKEWSCYNGAIRLYWPIRRGLEHPLAHPLWTSHSLLAGASQHDAAYQIRRQLRRRILGLSAFSVSEPRLLQDVRLSARRQESERLLREASGVEEWRELAEIVERDNDDLLRKLQERESQVRDLEAQVQNLQAALRWQPSEDEVAPNQITPPQTVADAVSQARENFPELVFGDDVDAGVEGLAQDAGPPEKVLMYLEKLSQLAGKLSAGSLGVTTIEWLRREGVDASTESETVRNSKREKKKRTWHDGNGDRVFDTHLKPSDATSPDRCVRIYFDYDPTVKKVVVGWLGRHLK